MRTSAAIIALVALAAVTAAPCPARAENKSWTAAQAVLPEKLFAVAGADLDQLRTSTVVQTVWPHVVEQHPELGQAIATIKDVCRIDAVTVATGVTLALIEKHRGVAVVSLTGVDEAGLSKCLKTIARKNKRVLTIKKDARGIIEYTVRGAPERRYVAWLGKNVLAIATRPTDRALLAQMIGGKGAGGDLATALAVVDTGAAVWGAVAADQEHEQDPTFRALHATAKVVAAGQITVDVFLGFRAVADARKTAAEMKKQVGKPSSLFPPEINKVLTAITVDQTGDTVGLHVTVPDRDVMALVTLAGAI